MSIAKKLSGCFQWIVVIIVMSAIAIAVTALIEQFLM